MDFQFCEFLKKGEHQNLCTHFTVLCMVKMLPTY